MPFGTKAQIPTMLRGSRRRDGSSGIRFSDILFAVSLFACGGCATNNLPNPPITDAALVWMGLPNGKGNWAETPGNSSVNITKIDATNGYFPPSNTMRITVDANGPLYLSPGRHTVGLICDILLKPSNDICGNGLVEANFVANHKYRFVAELSLHGDQAGNFEVTLLDITDGKTGSGDAVSSWLMAGGKFLWSPKFLPPRTFPPENR